MLKEFRRWKDAICNHLDPFHAVSVRHSINTDCCGKYQLDSSLSSVATTLADDDKQLTCSPFSVSESSKQEYVDV